MKSSGIVLIFIILLSARVFSQSDFQPVTKFDPARNPAKDLQNTITEAQKLNKNIILDVGGEWCIWCHRIDAFIEGHEEIKNFIDSNYIVMKVNFSQDNKNEEFLSKYPKINGYPHFFVLNKDGVLLHSQDTGKLEEGKDYNPDKFIRFLKAWTPRQN